LRIAKPATLLLVRHAHTDSQTRMCGWYDVQLSSRGHRQAKQLAQRLQHEESVSAVYASTSIRAQQTVRPIVDGNETKLQLLDGLREIYCGLCEGVILEEVQKRFPDGWRRNCSQTDSNFRWPEGESYVEFRNRVLENLTNIARRHANERVLVVTHTGVISQALGTIEGTDPARWEPNRPKHASITEILWPAENRLSLIRFSDTAHLTWTSEGLGHRGAEHSSNNGPLAPLQPVLPK